MTPREQQKLKRGGICKSHWGYASRDTLYPSRTTTIEQKYAGTVPRRNSVSETENRLTYNCLEVISGHGVSLILCRNRPRSLQWRLTHGVLDGVRPERGISRGQGAATMILALDFQEARCEAEHG